MGQSARVLVQRCPGYSPTRHFNKWRRLWDEVGNVHYSIKCLSPTRCTPRTGSSLMDHLARRRLHLLYYVYSPYTYTAIPVAKVIDQTSQNLFVLTKDSGREDSCFGSKDPIAELFNMSVLKINQGT